MHSWRCIPTRWGIDLIVLPAKPGEISQVGKGSDQDTGLSLRAGDALAVSAPSASVIKLYMTPTTFYQVAIKPGFTVIGTPIPIMSVTYTNANDDASLWLLDPNTLQQTEYGS